MEPDGLSLNGASCIRHVVAVPYPGRGHINPMMCLCRLLAARGGVLITFVVTEEWLSLLTSGCDEAPSLPPPGVRFRTISNVIPSEHGRAADFVGFVNAVYTKMEAPFELLLDGLDRLPAAIVADMFLPWAVAVGNRRNIPTVSLVTMSATFFTVLYHYDRLPIPGGGAADGRQSAVSSGSPRAKEEEIVLEHYIPGLQASLRLSDFKSIGRQPKLLQLALEAFSWVRKAQVLLFTSFYELEPCIFYALQSEISAVYFVGPSIPYMILKEKNSLLLDCYNWLDGQTESSVLYVSLGSFLSVSAAQLEEIAMGLLASETKFLWVARGDTSIMQKIFEKMCGDMGVVVPWCDQLRVLCHPSVGGFLTHCGWNSTLEAVFAGVPMLTFPLFFDQLPNSRIIVEEWKIGLNLKEMAGDDDIVRSSDIAEAVKTLMDLNDSESKEMRERAKKLGVAAVKAIGEDGSSITDLNSFLNNAIL